jgi:hypothetical protein
VPISVLIKTHILILFKKFPSCKIHSKFFVNSLLDSFTATNRAPVAMNDLTIVGPRPEYNFEKPFYLKEIFFILNLNFIDKYKFFTFILYYCR